MRLYRAWGIELSKSSRGQGPTLGKTRGLISRFPALCNDIFLKLRGRDKEPEKA
jgi:hypothetical protein